MKRYLSFVILFLCLTGCATNQQFNADGSERIPVTFTYPARWNVYYEPDDSLIISPTTNGDDIENGSFSIGTTYIVIDVYSPEQQRELYDGETISALAFLQKSAERIEENWQELNDPEGNTSAEGSVSLLEQPLWVSQKVTVFPETTLIGGREMALMQTESTIQWPQGPSPFDNHWVAALEDEGNIIAVFGVMGETDETDFLQFFHLIVTSIRAQTSTEK
jgi:hypothetical protein